MKMRLVCATAGAICVLFAAGAGAEDAAKPVLALKGNCPVALIESNKEAAGDAEIVSIHGGYEYRFLNAKAKKKFDSKPEKYCIQLGGNCAVSGKLARALRGDPAIYAVHEKRIYIFASGAIRDVFLKDPARYADKHGSRDLSRDRRADDATLPQYEF